MLPKRFSTGTRYKSASEFNTPITISRPNAGQADDGTPLPETIVALTQANVAQWRNREVDKAQTRSAQASYKITIRYPKTYSLNAGMNILVRGQRHFIDSFSDEDGQRIQLSVWTWVENDTIVAGNPAATELGVPITVLETGTIDGGTW
jgi:SPP1 family predicted phage head-tail adaptor